MRRAMQALCVLAFLSCSHSMPPSVSHPLAGGSAPKFASMSTGDLEVGVPGSDRTRVTVVDFWASWCAGCRQTMPALNDLYRAHEADGVVVIGVSVDEAEEEALALARDIGASFPIVLDPSGRIAARYGVAQIPMTFVIDGAGTVRWIGRSPADARRAVDAVLDEPAKRRDPFEE